MIDMPIADPTVQYTFAGFAGMILMFLFSYIAYSARRMDKMYQSKALTDQEMANAVREMAHAVTAHSEAIVGKIDVVYLGVSRLETTHNDSESKFSTIQVRKDCTAIRTTTDAILASTGRIEGEIREYNKAREA